MTIKWMALMVWVVGAVAHGNETHRKLTVCLRVAAPERHIISPLAKELAAKMFANIGISLEWKSREAAVESSPAPITIEMVSGTPKNLMPGALAFALPYEGSHITVFLDRVETMEFPAIVLAHVMVHEITHVVQGVSRHSDTGLMKARWTTDDILKMRNRPMAFAPEDLELIYHGLSTRRGLTGTIDGNRGVWRDERVPQVGFPSVIRPNNHIRITPDLLK